MVGGIRGGVRTQEPFCSVHSGCSPLKKIWPTFEREVFAPRVSEASVIPIILDDTKFVGVPQDIVGIHFKVDPTNSDWKKKVDEEIVYKLIDKLSE